MLNKPRFLLLAYVIVVLLAALYQYFQPDLIIYDALEYDFAAENLYGSETLYSGNLDLPIDYRLFSKRTAGYPLYRILQWNNGLLITLSQIMLLILLYMEAFWILSHFTGRRIAYTTYGLLMLFTPVLVLHTSLGMSDLLLAVVVTTIVCILMSKTSTKRKVRLLSWFYLIGVLIKPVMLPGFVFILIYYVAKGVRPRNTAAIATIVLVVGGFSLLNQKNTSVLEYSNISTINLATYNAKLTIASAYGFDSAQRYSAETVQHIPRNRQAYAEFSERLKQRGTQTLLDNPIDYIKVHLIGMVKMLVDPGRFEIYTFFGEPTADISLTEMIFSGENNELRQQLNTRPILLYLFYFLLIVNVLKLFLALFSIRSDDKRKWLIVLVIAYFLVLTGPVGAARFFVPCAALLIVLSSMGAVQLSDLLKKRSEG